MDEIACGEEVWQGWVPLYYWGGTREEAGPTVPLVKCDVYSNIIQTYMVTIFHMTCMCTLCIGARSRQEVKDGGLENKVLKPVLEL